MRMHAASHRSRGGLRCAVPPGLRTIQNRAEAQQQSLKYFSGQTSSSDFLQRVRFLATPQLDNSFHSGLVTPASRRQFGGSSARCKKAGETPALPEERVPQEQSRILFHRFVAGSATCSSVRSEERRV